MKRSSSKEHLGEINFEEWICGRVDPIIKHVESLIGQELSEEQTAIKAYWVAFAQNTINLSRVLSYLPHHFTQVMLTFRLLQETSADIFYLKNHRESLTKLAQIDSEVQDLKISGNFSLRSMSQLIVKTDIRGEAAIKSKKDGTQARIEAASRYLEDNLGEGLTKDLNDINKFLNGYSHFNPAGIYLQKNLTDYGYVETYMKIFTYYPAWLYLVLVSLSDLLSIDELHDEKSKKIIEKLKADIEKSHDWEIGDFTPR